MGFKSIDRRTFMRGTAAAAAALPLSGLLGSTSALAQDAANPFGLADGELTCVAESTADSSPF